MQIEQLLCERVSLRGICRVVGVSLTWLFHFMVECFTACPDHLHLQLPARPTVVVMSRLEAEADEMWRGAALGRVAMSSRDDHEKDGYHVLTRPKLRE